MDKRRNFLSMKMFSNPQFLL